MTSPRRSTTFVPDADGADAPAPAWRRALTYELGIWRSLAGWALRRGTDDGVGRVDAATGGRPPRRFSYLANVSAVLWLWIFASAAELVAVHLLVARWPLVQASLLVIGIWGLAWMLGLRAALVRHPHLCDDTGLHVRHGATTDVGLPWPLVTTVTRRTTTQEGSRVIRTLDRPEGGTALQVVVGNQTNLTVRLREPLPVSTPAGPVTVVQVDLWADEPDQLLAEVRRRLTSSPEPSGPRPGRTLAP